MRRVFIFFLVCIAMSLFPGAVSAKVFINELLWMGSDLSSSDEFIELYNSDDAQVDVSGWVITKFSAGNDVSMLTLPAGTIIPSKSYFVISRYPNTDVRSVLASAPGFTSSSLTLSNATLRIGLYTADPTTGTLIDSAGDGAVPIGGLYTSGSVWKSMERKKDCVNGNASVCWQSSSAQSGLKTPAKVFATPGAANSNSAPQAALAVVASANVGQEVVIDASESIDVENDPLTFEVDFGDGTARATGAIQKHVYAVAGTYTITVTVRDGSASAQAQKQVQILPLQSQPAPTPPEVTSPPTVQCAAPLTITELLPDPVGSDTGNEYIEIYNPTSEPVLLLGWKVRDASGKTYALSVKESIAGGSYITVYNAQSGIALNNTSTETIELVCDEVVRDSVTYEKSTGEGISYSKSEGKFAWSTVITPGAVNTIVLQQRPPVIQADVPTRANAGEKVVFSASDTTDPDGDAMTYVWTINGSDGRTGETIEYTFGSAGDFTVKLRVEDVRGAVIEKEWKVQVQGAAAASIGQSQIVTAQPTTLQIVKISANPKGSDVGVEYIVMRNTGTEPVSLLGWSIRRGKQSKKTKDIVIAPGEEQKITSAQGLPSLTNGGDTLELVHPSGSVIQKVAYPKMLEGDVYTWSGSTWTYTPSVTAVSSTVTAASADAVDVVQVISPQDVGLNTEGKKVEMRGTVVAGYGEIAAGTVLISHDGATILVYSSQPRLSGIAQGDVVRLTGKIGISGGRYRLVVGIKDVVEVVGKDVVISASAGEAPLVDLQLTRVRGEVGKVSSTGFQLLVAGKVFDVMYPRDPSAQVIVHSGDELEVTAVVKMSGSKTQLLMRSKQDYTSVQKEVDANSDTDADAAAMILPAISGVSPAVLWSLLAMCIVVCLGIGAWYWRKNRNSGRVYK